MICENCNTELEYFEEGNSCGWKCSHCGWNIVTTNTNPIDTDENLYSISIPAVDNYNATMIKAMSAASGFNSIKSRNALMAGFEFTDVSAKDAMQISKQLSAGGVVFTISPEFPYES